MALDLKISGKEGKPWFRKEGGEKEKTLGIAHSPGLEEERKEA